MSLQTAEEARRATTAGGARRGRAQRLTVKLSVLLISVLCGLLLAEVALRLIGFSFPTFYTPDQTRGYALRPGAEGWYRKEGIAYVRVNQEGLRDREHLREKPADTYRIAVLGDSYAEALQVDQRDAFWAVLEERLRDCPTVTGERQVEVLNFGVSGYGTAQQLLTLREHVWAYRPDLVLLAFTTNNDVTDNSRALKQTEEIPYFIFREGELILDDSFRSARSFQLRQAWPSRAGRWLRESSRVIQAVHQGQSALKNYLARRRAQRDKAARAVVAPPPPPSVLTPGLPTAVVTNVSPLVDEIGIDNLIYQAPRDAAWQEAWRVTEKLVAQMGREVESRGAKFIVVTLSNGIQVHPDQSAREAFMRRVGAQDLFYPDQRLKSVGERDGFSVINLAPELRQYAERERVFLHGFAPDLGNGHWNQRGHRLAGELLAHKLCAAPP